MISPKIHAIIKPTMIIGNNVPDTTIKRLREMRVWQDLYSLIVIKNLATCCGQERYVIGVNQKKLNIKFKYSGFHVAYTTIIWHQDGRKAIEKIFLQRDKTDESYKRLAVSYCSCDPYSFHFQYYDCCPQFYDKKMWMKIPDNNIFRKISSVTDIGSVSDEVACQNRKINRFFSLPRFFLRPIGILS